MQPASESLDKCVTPLTAVRPNAERGRAAPTATQTDGMTKYACSSFI